MQSSSRFFVAVHIMAGLALVYLKRPEHVVSSENIAWSVNTNPVVIRRILSVLKKHGLVKTLSGAAGGSAIARSPQEISLYQIYRAVEQDGFFRRPDGPVNEQCPVGSNIATALQPLLQRAEAALATELKTITLSDVADSLREQIDADDGERPA